MRVRKLNGVVAAAAAIALVVGGLSACDTKVGQAAIVDGHHISESDLAGYVTLAGPSSQVLAKASTAGQSVDPKIDVIQILIQRRLFEQALEKNGGLPTSGELAALHDRAAATFLGTQLTGTKLDNYLQGTQGSFGYAAKYANELLNTIELEAALAVRIQASSLADLTAAVNKLHATVQVNPRYGTWNPSTLSMGGPTSTVPDFLKLEGTASATPAASAPAG